LPVGGNCDPYYVTVTDPVIQLEARLAGAARSDGSTIDEEGVARTITERASLGAWKVCNES
jgi:hypothetical protein